MPLALPPLTGAVPAAAVSASVTPPVKVFAALARLAATAVVVLAVGAVASTSAPAHATPAQGAALVRVAAQDPISFVGASDGGKDILMQWRGTCSDHTELIGVTIKGEHWGGWFDTPCSYEGTYEGSLWVYDYEDAGLRFGQIFTYTAHARSWNIGFLQHTGQATLHEL